MSTASDSTPEGFELNISPDTEGVRMRMHSSPTQKPDVIIASASQGLRHTFSQEEAKECMIDFRVFVDKQIRKIITPEMFDTEIASGVPSVMYDQLIAKLQDEVVKYLGRDAVHTALSEQHLGGFNKPEVQHVAVTCLPQVIQKLKLEISQ